MDLQQFFNIFGVLAGFSAFILFWLTIVIWLMVDAQKRGLLGWVWAFVGLLSGPVGLVIYFLFWRGRFNVLPIVAERDKLIHLNELKKTSAKPKEEEIDSQIKLVDIKMDEQVNPTKRPPIPRQYQ